jgi:NTP pyrophosphatase (non-canonical NTP hydrolase)
MSKMDYEQEVLTILMEECGEVIQAASKIIRFGADQQNLDQLEKELGDLYCMIDLLHAYDMVSFTNLDDYSQQKYEKLKKWSNLIDLGN